MNKGRAVSGASTTHRDKFADVTPHRQFEYRWNQLQGALEIVVALVVFLALAGLLGTGPLSSASVSAPRGDFVVRYDRIMRRTVQTKIVFDLRKPAAGDRLIISVPDSILDRLSMQGMEPRASAARIEEGGIAYSFDLGATRRGRVTFNLKPAAVSFYSATIQVDNEPVTLQQIILP